jgi:hypothetical protein
MAKDLERSSRGEIAPRYSDPFGALRAEMDRLFDSFNTEYAKVWPNITVKREPPSDAKDWEGKPYKITLAQPWRW